MFVFAHPGQNSQNWHRTKTDILKSNLAESELRDKTSESLPGNMKVNVKAADPGGILMLLNRTTPGND